MLCIPARLLIALIAAKIPKDYLKILGAIMLLPAIGIMTIYLFGSKTADSQLQWLGEEKVWWGAYRPLHGIIYFTFAIMAMKGDKNAWYAIVADAVVGSFLFIQNQVEKGTIDQLSA